MLKIKAFLKLRLPHQAFSGETIIIIFLIFFSSVIQKVNVFKSGNSILGGTFISLQKVGLGRDQNSPGATDNLKYYQSYLLCKE